MTRYIVRTRPKSLDAVTLLGAEHSEEIARAIVKACDCEMTHFQPATRLSPMTILCDAKDKTAIARIVRCLDLLGPVRSESAEVP
jgi:hypothetical protein